MKKIIEISIDNYKGYITKETIKLPKGENLLIYGENGSGKSSLFNALRHFLQSSRDNTIPFDLNVFSSRTDGKIELKFKDYDPVLKKAVPDSESSFIACESAANSTNNQPFIQLGHTLSGFLDYSQLLKVYLHKGARPNLFDLINDLIGDFIPTAYGFSLSLNDLISNIHKNLRKSHQRNNRSYTEGKHKFTQLQAVYNDIINNLDSVFNSLMSTYFPDFKLGIHLSGTNIALEEDCPIKETRITGSIFIEVNHNGVPLNDYNIRLNEARLSAIAICLYLASLKLRNKNSDVKLLYLDDVFIGLDSANRRPILNIIKQEFPDYQIFISTYDKSWYSLAKEILNDANGWKHIELYEGEIIAGTLSVAKPIIVEGCSFIDKAKTYLLNQENPDYPAAANYMRKAFEELLTTRMYPSAIKDNNLENIPGYKIPVLIKNSKLFLSTLQHEPHAPTIIGLLDQLMTYLRPMLHPLSHYAPGEPVYKKELTGALDIYDKISNILKNADYLSNLKPILSRGSKFIFKIKGNDWELEYALQAEYDMFRYVDASGNKLLSICPIKVRKIKETDTTTGKTRTKDITSGTKNLSQYSYNGIDDCVARITAYLMSPAENKTDCHILTPHTDMFFLPKVSKKAGAKIEYKIILTSKL